MTIVGSTAAMVRAIALLKILPPWNATIAPEHRTANTEVLKASPLLNVAIESTRSSAVTAAPSHQAAAAASTARLVYCKQRGKPVEPDVKRPSSMSGRMRLGARPPAGGDTRAMV